MADRQGTTLTKAHLVLLCHFLYTDDIQQGLNGMEESFFLFDIGHV